MKLSAITIYPIKSTKGISLKSASVAPRGLDHDRRWMLIDQQNQFITARAFPQLLQVEVSISNRQLQLKAPEMATQHLPIHPAEENEIEVIIWRDACKALTMNQEINQWFSRYLGVPCRLVYLPDSSHRPVDAHFGAPGDEVSLADGFPLLVISESSLEDLNRRASEPLVMRRFRPNLEISGSGAYEEDQWHRVTIGNVEFEAVKPCSRCIITTIDPETGVKSHNGEPLRTLSSYRKTDDKVFFGMNLIPRSSGLIYLDDPVVPLL